MAISRIQIAKPDIIKYFSTLPTKVLRYSDISKIVNENRDFWRLAQSMTTNKFISFMLKSSRLKRASFNFPNRKEVRYVWGEVPLYTIILSLNSNGYFSHFTAMRVHDLTEQDPKTIYLNSEQPPPHGRDQNLNQTAIDNAFKRKVRVSKNIANYEGYKICTISSMGTGRLGIIELEGSQDDHIIVTDIERTLIDISLRPIYSGGIFEVLNAFRMAEDKVSINRLAAMLKSLGYIYPYHQVIGFYLERAGVYSENRIKPLRKFEFNYDFYLTHSMQDIDYSPKWRLYFPKGF